MALARSWLLGQGALLLVCVGVFGLVFPLIGVTIGATGLAPPGEDPLEIAFVLGLAGPCTAVLYLPGAVLSLLAGRRVRTDPEGAFPLVIAASLTSAWVCAPGIVPIVLYLLARNART